MSTENPLASLQKALTEVQPSSWSAYGGGWRGEISTALVDAVFSIRARYRSQDPSKGVFGRVKAFRKEHSAITDSLPGIVELGADSLSRIMGATQTGGRLKSEAAIEAAENLIDSKVRTSAEFTDADPSLIKKAYTRVPGLGPVTFEYFSMLLGIPGVKADTMILRFVNRALAADGFAAVKGPEARQLVVDAFKHQQTAQVDGPSVESLTHFEHALWLTESDRAAQNRRQSRS